MTKEQNDSLDNRLKAKAYEIVEQTFSKPTLMDYLTVELAVRAGANIGLETANDMMRGKVRN